VGGIRAQFNAGNVGILLDEPQFAGVIATATPPVPFKWDVAKYPPGPKKDVMLANAGLWVMSNKSANKQAAWEVIKSWTTRTSRTTRRPGLFRSSLTEREGFLGKRSRLPETSGLPQLHTGPDRAPEASATEDDL
jgi:hypothetical protein